MVMGVLPVKISIKMKEIKVSLPMLNRVKGHVGLVFRLVFFSAKKCGKNLSDNSTLPKCFFKPRGR